MNGKIIYNSNTAIKSGGSIVAPPEQYDDNLIETPMIWKKIIDAISFLQRNFLAKFISAIFGAKLFIYRFPKSDTIK